MHGFKGAKEAVNDKGKSDKLRLFVAIELPPEAQNALSSLKETIGRKLRKARWIESKNLHLTLQFLGYCPRETVKDISARLNEATEGFSPFEFRLDTLGAFPSAKQPRVFWIGVSEGKEAITRAQGRVEELLKPLGFEPEDRAFHPHITLARFKVPEDLRGALSLVDATSIYPVALKAEGIVLFLSELSPKGANYSPVEKFFFKKP